MSEEMKVGDIFKLPILCGSGDGNLYSDNLRHVIVFDDSDANCYEQKRVTSIALNNHDRLTEENRKLREALKLITDQSEKYTAKTKGKGVKVREIREYDLLSAKQMLEEL